MLQGINQQQTEPCAGWGGGGPNAAGERPTTCTYYYISSSNSSHRRRLTPEESRDAALDAARTLLIEMGPQAVTLKAVASRIGRTHANLLHHFGSASGLQKALIAHLADTITTRIGAAAMKARIVIALPRLHRRRFPFRRAAFDP